MATDAERRVEEGPSSFFKLKCVIVDGKGNTKIRNYKLNQTVGDICSKLAELETTQSLSVEKCYADDAETAMDTPRWVLNEFR